MDQFDVYFRRADLDQDGRISGNEAVTFFQGANLPRQVLAQIWMIADQNRTGFLGRQEFYNALKLVTVAQSKRDLTPDIIKAALYSPASAKIPAPQINLTPMPSHQSNATVISSVPPSGAATTMAPPSIGVRGMQGLTSQQSQVMRPPRPPTPSSSFQYPQAVPSQAMPLHGGNKALSYAPSSSTGPGVSTVVSHAGTNSQANQSMRPVTQVGYAMTVSGLLPSTQPGAQGVAMSTQPASSKLSDSVGGLVESKDSKALAVAGNGHAADSLFGDVFSVPSVQTKQDSPKVNSPVNNSPISSAVAPPSSGAQSTVKSVPPDSLQTIPTQQSMVGLNQQGYLSVKSNQQLSLQASTALPTGAITSASPQSQPAWPRMTQSDIQKYTKVFMQVDTDRDGKITGEQARNLFLSWRLPRDVLKQVWDLSDQDNDSMLSLREFCIALYMMERYREGRPLPTSLPSTIMLDETLMPVPSQPAAPLGNTVWRATPGFQQPQVMRGPRAVASAGGGKPPRPVPVPSSEDATQPSRQKAKVPVLEKHLLDQLSTEEQNSLSSKFQEATDAEKKVAELEKEITDAREKIQFYHAKMQELILYKSRCDNRLNEITERVSADKREVDSLAKTYEEKYRKAGDVASKLTIEEATFRNIQEIKMDLYRAIVKLEQDGNADGIQDRADRIQLDLEVLVKSLNERCKTYGLRAKPTSLVELPFGWQPGIQEGAADWDENWDKFEDEGFTFVKELTLDVQNVVAPPKPKSSLVQDKESLIDESGVVKSSSEADVKAENVHMIGERIPEHERANTQSDEQTASSPPESPARSNALESESREFEVSHLQKDISFDGSPHATQSEHGGAESMFSGDKGFDEPGWGAFDMHYDSDAAWDFNHVTTKDADSERRSDNYLFGLDLGLNPIRTGPKHTDNMFPKQGPFFDSVPSTPLQADNMFPKQSPFFDSVPSTPMQADSMYPKQSPFVDSVPSTPMYNSVTPHTDNVLQRKSPFAFADSVPSTPMNSGNSPRRFNEVSEERAFDSFSRFDSFNMHDGGLFTPRDSSLSRFDSMNSTRDSEYDGGLFASHDSLARFDSFRSTTDSDYNFGAFPPRDTFTRFDSIRSTGDSAHSHGFSSFDDADPFGSNDPFKTSMESQTPRRDSDSWKAF